MNIPVLIVAVITLVAFFAHLIGGTRETAKLEPDGADPRLMSHWVQAMGAFQMLSVDLLAVGGVLLAVAVWDLGAVERIIIQAGILLFLAWGVVWVVQMLWLKRSGVSLLKLPHWLVWFVCSGLLVWGLNS